MDVDVIVVGAGPAGLSATLMLARSRRSVLVIDDGRPRNRFAAHMHGLVGYDGTPPAELTARGRADAERYGVAFADDRVSAATAGGRHITLTTAGGATHRARAVVVASGIADVLPDVPGLAERWGTTVLHCPYCHGWEVREQRLGVLLTSSMGLHQAELARQLSDSVTVFTNDVAIDSAARTRLAARSVTIVDGSVSAVTQEATVHLADGGVVTIDALFTAGTPRPHDDFADALGARRVDDLLEVDALHRTSHPRLWACGNAVLPFANVPLSLGDGAMTGAAVNAALTAEDFDHAVAAADAARTQTPAEHWDGRYSAADRVWSGRVNAAVADIAGTVGPGAGRTSLDLGCGEGADVIWLAEHGWSARGVDISSVAVARATEAARERGVPARFESADLSTWEPEDTVDLVTASFLHSTVELPREDILRRAATWVAPGGHLLIVSHAAPPPWSHAHHHPTLPTPEEELHALALDASSWDILLSEVRERTTTGPDGEPAVLEDGIVLARRRDVGST
ncbi:bifunctional NAD(P)/FAD-dependent oxidoreductase/class I SAM-dependent methyltransferase [Microbacterium sp. SORGH_AS_0888]|uniref:bifunctional NAD(P)/FAD-dependent oxidoreductase/class I SAM-dependent methyltransferase n=1 Tax=Microbacterium sp. SORGH_AS_0888 TaxID=3041791 RepID=UPI0027840D09|nr:bifunctional NAD(P)/FAD-dependent oxidoreductase/class I SAM-dependent methyltransferase [Microbacterium sp. SORGH_AS_0888]MDQ1130822.1 thioredoxin reductase/SAM-dependent methyltransferase [Microbacterium sp. SORGH_AS_0888]